MRCTNEAAIQAAIDAIQTKEGLSIRIAATLYYINRMTLTNRLITPAGKAAY